MHVDRRLGETPGEVAGATGVTGNISTTLLVPNSWKRQKSSGAPVWLAGHGSCFYRVTTKATLTLAPSSTATARVARDLPDIGPRILDSGTRNSAAWRVTRPQMDRRTHLRAVSSFATAATAGATIPPGQSLWLEVWPDGLSRPITQAVTRAGLDATGYSAHSLRAGFVTYAAKRGATSLQIARQTRHKDLASIGIYTRIEDAWEENAATQLPL